MALVAQRTLGNPFAFGTLLVNGVGCLLLGLLLEAERHSTLMTQPIRMLVAVGFLGAFTTFSDFGYETMRYLQEGAQNLALLNVGANIFLGCGGVWMGWLAARSIFPAV